MKLFRVARMVLIGAAIGMMMRTVYGGPLEFLAGSLVHSASGTASQSDVEQFRKYLENVNTGEELLQLQNSINQQIQSAIAAMLMQKIQSGDRSFVTVWHLEKLTEPLPTYRQMVTEKINSLPKQPMTPEQQQMMMLMAQQMMQEMNSQPTFASTASSSAGAIRSGVSYKRTCTIHRCEYDIRYGGCPQCKAPDFGNGRTEYCMRCGTRMNTKWGCPKCSR